MYVRLWFPGWFVPNLENRAYLEGLRDKLPGYQLAIEFRDRMAFQFVAEVAPPASVNIPRSGRTAVNCPLDAPWA